LFSQTLTWTGEIETLTPLHIGGGDAADISSFRQAGTQGEAGLVETVQRDGRNNPFIPGSSLKGILRRAFEEGLAADASLFATLGAHPVASLFGEIKNDGAGQAGPLWVYDAPMIKAPVQMQDAPCAGVRTASFVAARTAVDAESGTAEDHLLFRHEMVAPGAVFRLRLALRVPSARDGDVENLAAAIAGLLELAGGGMGLGKGQTGGHGRVRITPGSVSLDRQTLGPRGWGAPEPGKVTPLKVVQAGGAPAVFNLICEGPFLIRDSSWNPKKQKDLPQVKAQRLNDATPLVLGSSVRGVLRARIWWIAACEALADGKSEVEARTAGEAAADRLFGAPARAARLRVEKVEVRPGASPRAFTSVALDRHSSAPVDGALFTSETFIGTRLTVSLRLKPGKHDSAGEQAADEALFQALQSDIRENGLELGGGAAKGFGWFEVEEGQ